MYIAHDFNQANIDWTNSTVKLNHPYCKKTANKLLKVVTESSLEQLVHEPTRKDSILDIILTNNTSIVRRVSTEGGVSDHSIVMAGLNLRTQRKRIPKRKVYIRSKAPGHEKGHQRFCTGVFWELVYSHSATEMGQDWASIKWHHGKTYPKSSHYIKIHFTMVPEKPP